MGNSKLTDYVKRSPNNSGKRTAEISKITPHHMAGRLTVEKCGEVFQSKSRQASSNYGIDSKGRVGLYVDEANRAWTSSSKWNDQRSVTIEVANSETGGDWPVSGKAWDKLVDLCADIVRRNPGIKRADGRTPGLNYTGDKTGSLTEHRMFAATNCPGPYLHSRMKRLEREVNAKLDAEKEEAGERYVLVAGGRPVRTVPRPTAAKVTTLAKGSKVTVSLVRKDGLRTWGRIGKNRWLCLRYGLKRYAKRA